MQLRNHLGHCSRICKQRDSCWKLHQRIQEGFIFCGILQRIGDARFEGIRARNVARLRHLGRDATDLMKA